MQGTINPSTDRPQKAFKRSWAFWKTPQGRLGSLLLGAVGCGLLATFAARGYLDQQIAAEKARLVPKQTLVDVVVAKGDLPKGALVGPETMALRAIPKEYISSVSITPEKYEGFIGARLANPMRSGEVLLTSSTEGADIATFSTKVKPGIRAITVSVDEVTSVSGMLQPGDRIDLLWSVKPSSLNLHGQASQSNNAEQTVVFMQDVRVLATGKQVRPGADESRPRGYSTVTLEATALQAQQLVVAQRSGKLTALLRNPDDSAPLNKSGADLSHLLDLKPIAAPILVRSGPEVLVGGKGDLGKQRQALAAAVEGQ
jgi:pilus assembly protein CpaB